MSSLLLSLDNRALQAKPALWHITHKCPLQSPLKEESTNASQSLPLAKGRCAVMSRSSTKLSGFWSSPGKEADQRRLKEQLGDAERQGKPRINNCGVTQTLFSALPDRWRGWQANYQQYRGHNAPGWTVPRTLLNPRCHIGIVVKHCPHLSRDRQAPEQFCLLFLNNTF
jgi:hypothetical protein